MELYRELRKGLMHVWTFVLCTSSLHCLSSYSLLCALKRCPPQKEIELNVLTKKLKHLTEFGTS